MTDYCGKAWDGFLTKVQQARSKDAVSEVDIYRYFLRLQRLVEKKTRMFWHRDYFDKYIENNMVPWGLHI